MSKTQRMGDDRAGFSVTVEESISTIRVRAWGFWNPELAGSFGTVVGDACSTCPQPSVLVIDMSAIKPICHEGQRSFGTLMDALPGLHVKSTTVVTSNQLIKLQLLRIANQSPAKGAVQFTQAEQGPLAT
jgi:hypothetical protein